MRQLQLYHQRLQEQHLELLVQEHYLQGFI